MAWLLPSDRTLGIGLEMDSTVVEADVRSPTDSGLASDGVRVLAREGKRLAARAGGTAARARDRSRAVGKRLRAIGQDVEATLARSRNAKTRCLTARILAGADRFETLEREHTEQPRQKPKAKPKLKLQFPRRAGPDPPRRLPGGRS